jgi:acetyl esterase
MSATSLPLKTRLFAAAFRVLIKPPHGAADMIALRARRERLLHGPAGRWIFGGTAPDVRVHQRTADDLRLLVYTPRGGGETPRPVVVDFHGGGFCLGSPEQTRWLASRVAARVGAVVVTPAYRLAPEHPYPAAVQDAWTALRWVHAHAAELGGDPDRLAVMGDSAGATLAAVAALRARDEGRPALRGQVLIYPAVEMYERWPSEAANANAPVLTSALMHTFARLYLADAHGTTDWQASPIRATDHTGLPPTLILTAGHDPLHDHGTRYARTLTEAGVRVELVDDPRAVHGFLALPGVVTGARAGLAQVTRFLTTVLAADDQAHLAR